MSVTTSLARLSLAVVMATASLAALAQSSPAPSPSSVEGGSLATDSASPNRAGVKAQTRRAAANKSLEPAGEAPDPVGAPARVHRTAHKAGHHAHHGTARHRMHKAAARHRAVQPARPAEPMAEPKK